jgi:mannosyl-3-phosphoglycerate phosphatase
LNFAGRMGFSRLVAKAEEMGERVPSGTVSGTRIIFSDVDGTLLSESGRAPSNWGDIRASLSGALIVLTSSRTVEELLAVQRFLGVRGPVLAENGAILVLSEEWTERHQAGTVMQLAGKTVRLVHLGTPAAEFRGEVEAAAREHGVAIETEREVFSAHLHHPMASRRTIARRALARTHSLLLRMKGDEEARSRFLAALGTARLTVSNSGRWYVVQANSSKGLGVRAFINLALSVLGGSLQIVGVGDRENDVSLLTATTKRFVMRLANGEVDPTLAATADATILTTPGVDGWTEIAADLQIISAPESLS